jgi:large subunit ribosomal protein L20
MKINAATREHGIPYNTFAAVLTRSNIELDRKILSDLAANEPYTFRAISQVLVQEPTFEQLY